MIYLDWAATAPPDKEILEISREISNDFPGNPSSLHSLGRDAANKLKQYREQCSRFLNVAPETLYFTSGASESNNLVISSLFLKQSKGEVIVSGFEHPSVWEPVQQLKRAGYSIKVINPGKSGIITPEKLSKMLSRQTTMVCIMAVHNETGAIQPIQELRSVLQNKETEESIKPIHFHCDMVQAPGKIDYKKLLTFVDSASFSGHKFGAPRGAGLLYLKKAIDVIYCGGGQESGIRPGTENLVGIAGLSEALTKSDDKYAKTSKTGNYLISQLKKINKIKILPENRNKENFTSSIISVVVSPLPGEVLVRVLDEKGFCISTGSACSSNKKMKTRGLESMGVSPKDAFSSIRISIGPTTCKDEIDDFIQTFSSVIDNLIP